jgi:ribonuclease P protein component
MSNAQMFSQKFPKKERLTSEKSIERLFASGKKFTSFPLKMVCLVTEEARPEGENVKALFSVSKRNFKRATDRNLIKRRLREAYRLNKSLLKDVKLLKMANCDVAFIYISKEITDFWLIDDKMKSLLMKFSMLTYTNNS